MHCAIAELFLILVSFVCVYWSEEHKEDAAGLHKESSHVTDEDGSEPVLHQSPTV